MKDGDPEFEKTRESIFQVRYIVGSILPNYTCMNGIVAGINLSGFRVFDINMSISDNLAILCITFRGF